MQRILRIAVLLTALLQLLCLSCRAQELPVIPEVDPEEGLTQEALDALGTFDPNASPSLLDEALRLLRTAALGLSGTLRTGLGAAAVMLSAVLLCGLLEHDRTRVQLVGTLVIVGACAGPMGAMVTLASSTLQQLREYSLLLLPSLAGLGAASGTGATGAAVYAGGALWFDLLLRMSSGLILPLVWLLIAAYAADSALGGGMLTPLAEFLKWLASGLLKWTSYLFTGYLAVTSVLSAGTDAAGLRATKAALSGVVPVVGSIISDASEALLGAAGTLKSAVGVYGMLAVLALCLAPFLKIALQFLILKATAAVSGLLGQPELSRLIARLSDAMSILLGLCGAYSMAALLCIVLCMKTVGL